MAGGRLLAGSSPRPGACIQKAVGNILCFLPGRDPFPFASARDRFFLQRGGKEKPTTGHPLTQPTNSPGQSYVPTSIFQSLSSFLRRPSFYCTTGIPPGWSLPFLPASAYTTKLLSLSVSVSLSLFFVSFSLTKILI